MTYIFVSRPKTIFEADIVDTAEKLVNDPSDVMNVLDLFVALNIYKLNVQGQYSQDPDQTQINLFKEGRYKGLRIYRVGHNDFARVLETVRY